MSVIEQKFADQLDPAFLDSGVDGEDYEKHAEIMRNKVKSLGLEERLIEVRRVTKVVKGGNILSNSRLGAWLCKVALSEDMSLVQTRRRSYNSHSHLLFCKYPHRPPK